MYTSDLSEKIGTLRFCPNPPSETTVVCHESSQWSYLGGYRGLYLFKLVKKLSIVLDAQTS